MVTVAVRTNPATFQKAHFPSSNLHNNIYASSLRNHKTRKEHCRTPGPSPKKLTQSPLKSKFANSTKLIICLPSPGYSPFMTCSGVTGNNRFNIPKLTALIYPVFSPL